MKLSIKAGATSQSVNVFIRDSTSTTGGGLAAVAPAGGSLLTGTKLYYSFTGTNASAGVAVSLAVLAAVNSAWSSAGIVTLDGTNMIGWVRIDLPDAALTTGKGRVVSFLLFGGTNMAPTPFEIELTGWDNQDAVHGGMSALPNTACTTNASLLTSGTGTDQLSVASGLVNVGKINSVSTSSVTTVSAVVGTAQAITFNANNFAKVSLNDILATTLTETSGLLAGGFKQFFNVSTPTGTVNSLPNAVAGASGGLLIAGSNAATTFATLTSTGAFTTGGFAAGAITATTVTASGAVAFQSTFAVTTSTALGAISGSTLTLSGAVAFQSTFIVTGAVTFSSTFATTGTTTFNALTVTNATTLTGAVSLGSTLGVTGTVTFNAFTCTNNFTVSGNWLTTGTTTWTGAAAFSAGLTSNITGTLGTVTNLTNAPTVGDFTSTMKTSLVTAIWDGTISGHTTSGTFGGALNAAGSAGDPWTTTLPGAYSAGTAGHILGTALPDVAFATAGGLVTNGTGTGQISLSSGKVLLQATQSGVTIPTVTTVTNQLTAAAIATGVWQDATAGDFTATGSIGKSLYTSGNAPGAASGLALVGSAMTLSSAYDFAKGTVAMTESYSANGIAPTPVQAIFAIHQVLMDFVIASTSYTVKQLNNSTTAFVITLNDATTPTGAART